MYRTKLERLQAELTAGRDIDALEIVSRFGDLGADGEVIRRGWHAHGDPWHYIGRGLNPEQLTADAIAAMRRRYRGAVLGSVPSSSAAR